MMRKTFDEVLDGYTLPQILLLLSVETAEEARADERMMLVMNRATAEPRAANEFLEQLRDTAYGPKEASIQDAVELLRRAGVAKT